MTEHTAENDAGPCPLCGSVAGYADGPPCLTCHYEPSAENDAVMKPNEDGSAADPTRVHNAEKDAPRERPEMRTLPASAGVCPEAIGGRHVSSAEADFSACYLCGRVIPPGKGD